MVWDRRRQGRPHRDVPIHGFYLAGGPPGSQVTLLVSPARPLTGGKVKRAIATSSAAAMYNPVSQATLAPNGMVYTAGMIGRSPDTGQMLSTFDEQAHQALRNLGALLGEAGGTYADVLFVQLYLLDMELIERFNEIFRQYFAVEPPARAVCQPLKLYPGALVMFTAVACVGSA